MQLLVRRRASATVRCPASSPSMGVLHEVMATAMGRRVVFALVDLASKFGDLGLEVGLVAHVDGVSTRKMYSTRCHGPV